MDHLLFGVDWKTAGPDTGELVGYMSVFGNVDQGGDVVMPGAFRKTFDGWSRAKSPMPLIADHQLDSDGVIGSVVNMAEDNVGAKIRARFSGVERAQTIRQKMVEGHIRGLSFTYEPMQHSMGTQDGKQVRFLKEVKVYEATVTPFPMNQLALGSAKADQLTREVINLDLSAFLAAMRHTSELPAIAQKAVVDLLIPLYHPETAAAGETDGSTTADAAADTEPPAAGTAETKNTAAAYAVSLITPGPPDEAPDPATYPQRLLEQTRDDAEADALEESIKQALGATA